MKSKQLTTSQVAKLYTVTPDAVLKWVKNGKLPSTRTPGGHCRIAVADLPPEIIKKWEHYQNQKQNPESLYCWEYNMISGKVPDYCRECIVFKAMAKNCFVLALCSQESDSINTNCQRTCEECKYYAREYKEPRSTAHPDE